jgi:hypothetical protein
MSGHPQAEGKTPLRLSLDTWAVLLALIAVLLIRVGVIIRVPW